MTRTLRYLLLFVFTGLSGSAFAQEISGRVLDDKKEPLINAVVQVYQGGILKGGNVTDYDGNYTVKPLDPGYYDVLALYAGYDSIMITGVVVASGQRTTQNFPMIRKTVTVKGEFVVKAYKKPLVDQDKPTSKVITSEEISRIPTNQVTDLVGTTAGVYQPQRGKDVNMSGARTTGTLYVIDGVEVRSISGTMAGIDMAQGSVDQLEVITSGVPANYGDFSGGVVNITSRGVSQKMTGDVRVQHSIDGYKNNLVSFSIAGPVYKKKVKGETTKKPVLGFALSGDYYNDHDRYPDFNQQYTAKGDVLNRLQANPLHIISDNSGSPVYNYASAYVTYDSLTRTKITPSKALQEGRFNGKLDYQVTDNMHIVGGASFDYLKQDQYARSRELFDASSTPVKNTLTGRAYVRFTQKFGKTNDTSSRHSIISNAYYTVQADYQKTYQDQHDPQFKESIFDYAYVGKFNETRAPIYIAGVTDSASGMKGTVLTFSNPTGITFDRSHTLNPTLANYTTQVYNSLNGLQPQFISTIQAFNGMANGDEPKYTYDMFLSPGATQSAYIKFNSNQYALTVDASFDLLIGKTKHAIGFGLYYQQRIEKEFVAYANPNGSGTNSLWALMRQLVSSIGNGNLTLDKQHPLFVVNGKQYTLDQVKAGAVIPGPSDTIVYNYKNIGNSVFDQNLRKALGSDYTANGSNKDINIDALAPSTFSLNMFSADELLNSGHGYVYYFGYGYAGQAQTGTVNFNDFWTKKDANGNFIRPIGAFSPNYIAGYLLDKFNYKDLHFNIGVRIDRFSANTKVLKDPFSELAEKTVSQVPGSANQTNSGVHPANMGGNYVVYIDDNNSSAPAVISYRDGINWYDPTGKLILDPSLLKQYSNGRDPQPYLVNPSVKITDSNFNPNSSFTDYTPQVTIQPRLSFNFPISEVADFYAHYDIYAQRPVSNINANAADYFYLQQNANSIINNPNLQPEKTFDYEVGFQQKLTSSSALTISAFYKERKNQITLVPYLFAWPTTYYSYGNRDFSTTKGTTLFYDLRATNHLQMSLSYTLQFAEGTGSTPTSSNGTYGGNQISPNGLLQSFIQAGLPNLRYATALDYDSRHNIVANIDYRFKDGEGPVVAGKSILQNAGIDFICKARSGEPYTRYTDAQGSTVIGGIGGSRLPWHYGVDVRVDKDFALNFGKRHKDAPSGVKAKRPLFLKAIIQANNVLQTRDIIHVYGYTGRPDDNGYLTSSYGQQTVPQQTNPLSYSQLYQINYNNPDYLNYARTISFALEFNF